VLVFRLGVFGLSLGGSLEQVLSAPVEGYDAEGIAVEVATPARLQSGYGSVMGRDSGTSLGGIVKNGINRHKQAAPERTNAMSVRFYAWPE
jgi:hypothetical protein